MGGAYCSILPIPAAEVEIALTGSTLGGREGGREGGGREGGGKKRR